MRKEKYHIYLSNEELKRVVVYLINLKNKLIAEGRYTDAVDELLDGQKFICPSRSSYSKIRIFIITPP